MNALAEFIRRVEKIVDEWNNDPSRGGIAKHPLTEALAAAKDSLSPAHPVPPIGRTILPTRIEQLADRRDALCRLQPLCPNCDAQQVQLVDWWVNPAQWKCRVCRYSFELDLPQQAELPLSSEEPTPEMLEAGYNVTVGDWGDAKGLLRAQYLAMRAVAPKGK